MVRQLLDVVYQAVELPLRIDFLLPAQREAIQPLVVPQVAEHRFDGGEALAVAGLTFFAVDGLLHPVAVAFFGRAGFAPEEADLPDPGLLRGAQAFVPLFAGQAVTLAIEDGQIEFVLKQVVDRVFETARQQLLLQINRKESRAGVDFRLKTGFSTASTYS